ncbi:MAG: hypothetical protein LBR56_03915 [Sporomusaceae bacterium]|jgi:sulfatase maturation enzyme AslB (radical SAM superfamily)|nr:hypothetical protein [Sporomusaceae bacterium]
MRFTDLKGKKLILYGEERFCQTLELFLYDVPISLQVYDNAGNAAELINSAMDSDTVVVICSYEHVPYELVLEHIGLKYNQTYVLATYILWLCVKNDYRYQNTYENMHNKKIALYGSVTDAQSFLQDNPGIRVDYLVADQAARDFFGRPILKFADLQGRSDSIYLFILYEQSEDLTNQLSQVGFVKGQNYSFDKNFESSIHWLFVAFQEAVKTTVLPLSCNMLWKGIVIMPPEELRLCCVNPLTIGSVQNTTYDNLINSFTTRLFNASVLNGSYVLCRDCLFLSSALKTGAKPTLMSEMPEPETAKKKLVKALKSLSLGFDPSCNLTCKSCRPPTVIMYHKFTPDLRLYFDNIYKIILSEWLPHCDTLALGINGDTFASKFYSEIAFKQFTGNWITIQTNALLLNKPVLDSLIERYSGKELRFFISIDAASADVYKDLRGGNFNLLLKNLQELGRARRENKVSYIVINFIVQKRNFREMPDFVRLGKSINADNIYFQELKPYTQEVLDNYSELNVYDEKSSGHKEFCELLKDPIFDDKSLIFDIPRQNTVES